MRFIAFIIVFIMSMPVFAANYEDFAEDIKPAYLTWKQSLILTSRNNQDGARQAVQSFQKQWGAVMDKYLGEKPAEISGDIDFDASLKAVSVSMQEAENLINQGRTLGAHYPIEEVRYILWDMRARSGIVTLNDMLNDFHAVMETVIEEVEIALDALELQKIVDRKGLWLKAKWSLVAHEIENGGYGDEMIKTSDFVENAIVMLFKAADEGSLEMSDEAVHMVKKGFKKVFFSDVVY